MYTWQLETCVVVDIYVTERAETQFGTQKYKCGTCKSDRGECQIRVSREPFGNLVVMVLIIA